LGCRRTAALLRRAGHKFPVKQVVHNTDIAKRIEMLEPQLLDHTIIVKSTRSEYWVITAGH
jgi:hypothetical protein